MYTGICQLEVRGNKREKPAEHAPTGGSPGSRCVRRGRVSGCTLHLLSALILNRSTVSGRRLWLTPTGERCVVFQVPTPPNNNFSCYQTISHPAIPPSRQSYRTHAVSSWDLPPALGKGKVPPSDSGAGVPVCALSPPPLFLVVPWWIWKTSSPGGRLPPLSESSLAS